VNRPWLTSPGEKVLVVNADDFGLSPGVNRGILEAHARGILTSASLMVRRAAAEDALMRARFAEGLGIGLHLDLGEWRYSSGRWQVVEQVVDPDDPEAVALEVDRQIGRFVSLVGRAPTHLDSHQHVHLQEPARSAVLARGQSLGVPVRNCTPGVRFRGEFYGQDAKGTSCLEHVGVDALMRVLTSLPAGVTELGCHPGYAEGLTDPYTREREVELRALCDPEVHESVRTQEIRLLSYGTLSSLHSKRSRIRGA
jgi:predicted glycoside hydrolase/deacetylase ChbG (UPF0249 family)